MNLRINHVLENSRVQGPGERYTIWVQGCSLHCKGCNNLDTWEFDKGKLVENNFLIEKILSSKTSGLTITGGEPLDQLESVLEILRKLFLKKNIFLCSGYTYEQIKSDERKKQILDYIDILCSGPFNYTKKCVSKWKGSDNQEIIYFTNTGKKLLDLPIYKREYRINKKSGQTLITGFSV